MFQGFRNFILRGNVVDLAVAVVIGGAFNGVVTALVKDLITPFLGIFGKPDFSSFYLTFNGNNFLLGDFINSLISFVIVAGVIYFFVVTPMNRIAVRLKRGEKVDPTEKTCPECLSSVPIKARRCKFCTAPLKV